MELANHAVIMPGAEGMPVALMDDAREQPQSQITDDMVRQLLVKLEQQSAEIAALKAEKEKSQTISLKVSDKGGISVYGMGRFPVTLYETQWETVGRIMPQILEFAKTNTKAIAEKKATAKIAKALEKANEKK